jgi:beta-glucanase (GH16 family)
MLRVLPCMPAMVAVLNLIPPPIIGASFDNVNGGPPGTGWTKDFSDEFNGSSLDASKWNSNWRGGRWWKQPGEGGQTYYSDSNVVVANGTLQIITRRESIAGSKFTSGIVTSLGKYSVKAGTYLEARLKMPRGTGLWSSWWTCNPDVWPPEIDLMEMYDTTWACSLPQNWHYRDASEIEQGDQKYVDGTAAPWNMNLWGDGWYGDYHIYAADFQNDKIDFYIDGIKTHTSSSYVSKYKDMAQFLIFQIIGDGGWAPPLDATTPLPATYAIDWVRVWKKGSGGGSTTTVWQSEAESLSGGNVVTEL